MVFYPHQLLLNAPHMRTCEQKRKKRHAAIAQKLDLIEKKKQWDLGIQRMIRPKSAKKNADNKFLLTSVIYAL